MIVAICVKSNNLIQLENAQNFNLIFLDTVFFDKVAIHKNFEIVEFQAFILFFPHPKIFFS